MPTDELYNEFVEFALKYEYRPENLLMKKWRLNMVRSKVLKVDQFTFYLYKKGRVYCMCQNKECECKKREIVLYEIVNYDYLEDVANLHEKFDKQRLTYSTSEFVDFVNEIFGEAILKVGGVQV